MSTQTPFRPVGQRSDSESEYVKAIAALLTVTTPARVLSPRVADVLQPLGLRQAAVSQAVSLAMKRPVTPINASRRIRSALVITGRIEYYFRATYILRASQRINASLVSGVAVRSAVLRERRFYQQHLDAAMRREKAASDIDKLYRENGRILGWYAEMDDRTSAECRAAHGKNFEIDRRPSIGYPGTVHPDCRCIAGPPHSTEAVVYDIPARRRGVA